MSFMIFNGSPRGKKSNSNIIISWFTEELEPNPTVYLNKGKQHEGFIEESKAFDKFLFVFPLYVDGMPAQVKHFFELMSQQKEAFRDKEISFIIHSGFSEAIHLKNLENYLTRFSGIMAMKNYGVFIIPGSEGFKVMPARLTAKRAKRVAAIGKAYKMNEPFDQADKVALEGPLLQAKSHARAFAIMRKLGMSNHYWNQQLKKNKVFEQRFDAPYSKL